MKTNLFGFTPLSFEQFVQALAIQVFGPGVTVFGRGPDGGREATFSGIVPFPSTQDPWNGYGVIQAKCKDKTEGTQIDQAWALGQLTKEMEAYAKEGSKRRSPEYYVFATNVVLTPVGDSGGKDKACSIIEEYAKRIGLKDYRIWDGDRIEAFLNTHESLRRRFYVHLCPGEVIYDLARRIEGTVPNFEQIVVSYVEKSLRSEQDAKLDQAGKRTDDRTRLSQVFFDLPASQRPSEDPPEEDEGKLRRGILAHLVNVGACALSPRGNAEQQVLEDGTISSRYVLIGGPGSGKSTIGQFLAQIYRAAIVETGAPKCLLPETSEIVKDLKDRCAVERISWPKTPRFPVRVDLSAYAKSLVAAGHEKTGSLLEYLVKTIKGDFSLRVEDLVRWMSQYPWLLVLDGLDEVPAASNRSQVCESIRDFLAEACRVNSDLLVVATTRKDGYKNEFDGREYCERYLLPLSLPRALSYAKRFAEVKFGAQNARVNELVDCLREAAADDLTAKLMVTPRRTPS